MFSNDRTQMRQFFADAWRKAQAGEVLIPLEKLVADVIQLHPEYHALLEKPDQAIDKDFLPDDGESNPFLHMGMHISIHEQLMTDRPSGIRDLYQDFIQHYSDAHTAEHQLMEALAETLWEAQRAGTAPDEQAYLLRARQQLGKTGK